MASSVGGWQEIKYNEITSYVDTKSKFAIVVVLRPTSQYSHTFTLLLTNVSFFHKMCHKFSFPESNENGLVSRAESRAPNCKERERRLIEGSPKLPVSWGSP